jgi:hypothetical protein
MDYNLEFLIGKTREQIVGKIVDHGFTYQWPIYEGTAACKPNQTICSSPLEYPYL